MSAPVFNPEETPEGVQAVLGLGELRLHRKGAKSRVGMLMGILLAFMAAVIILTFFFGGLNYSIMCLLGVLTLLLLGTIRITHDELVLTPEALHVRRVSALKIVKPFVKEAISLADIECFSLEQAVPGNKSWPGVQRLMIVRRDGRTVRIAHGWQRAQLQWLLQKLEQLHRVAPASGEVPEELMGVAQQAKERPRSPVESR